MTTVNNVNLDVVADTIFKAVKSLDLLNKK